MKKSKESKFGKGFVYNLILFMMHFPQTYWQNKKEFLKDVPSIEPNYYNWSMLSMGKDHLYEIELPNKLKGTKIEKLFTKLTNDFEEEYHSLSVTNETISEIIETIKLIAIELDKYLGVKIIRGEYE